MILFGAGGIAVVVLDVLNSRSVFVDCCVDDNPDLVDLLGVKIIRSAQLENDIDRSQHEMIVCIGDPDRKAQLVAQYPGKFSSAVHSSAVVSESASIGIGTVVFQQCIIQARAKVGNHVIVNTAASIDHDCNIGDYVHIAPHTTLCGGVTVKNGANIGAASTVIQNLTIGEGAIVGAGAVVISDVPANAVVVGSPAKVIRTRAS